MDLHKRNQKLIYCCVCQNCIVIMNELTLWNKQISAEEVMSVPQSQFIHYHNSLLQWGK